LEDWNVETSQRCHYREVPGRFPRRCRALILVAVPAALQCCNTTLHFNPESSLELTQKA
jgi:hypothetical protein